jgi:hypothetical protein
MRSLGDSEDHLESQKNMMALAGHYQKGYHADAEVATRGDLQKRVDKPEQLRLC